MRLVTIKKLVPNAHVFGNVLIVTAFCLLNGCASYKEVKEMEVDSSTTFENVEAGDLSACVWELMKEDGGHIYHRSYDPIKKKWFVVSEFKTLLGSGNGDYNYSVSFQRIANKNTTVEIRSLKTIWGRAQAPIERILQKAKQCKDEL
mgnify:CR=1 FL=1